jgi:hypothetical protein
LITATHMLACCESALRLDSADALLVLSLRSGMRITVAHVRARGVLAMSTRVPKQLCVAWGLAFLPLLAAVAAVALRACVRVFCVCYEPRVSAHVRSPSLCSSMPDHCCARPGAWCFCFEARACALLMIFACLSTARRALALICVLCGTRVCRYACA